MFRRKSRTALPAPQTDLEARARGERMLTEAREELNRADAKAQVLLGVAGIGIGAVTGGLLAGSWSPLRLHTGLQWVWWAGAACALAALVCLAGAVYPRITRRAPGPPRYFGDIRGRGSAREIADALRDRANDDLTRVAEQIRAVSAIVLRKYLLIKWGFWLLLASIAATTGSAVADLAL
ncbi:Pycsar system effector family protein [Microtetraspora malaysiensis]|uniref:Pycsar system effector family protein n=1 Tax=Microtetraspora malaysiensis TaxID=161358 RepID=A0ABW6SHW2_9ACTN